MSDTTLGIRARELLYRARGRDWDYAFLLQPPPILGEGWYTLHRRIFAHVEPTEEPLLLRGELGVGLGEPFFATVFTDHARRDSQDRPIAHYLAWLGQSAEGAPGMSFGPGLVSALAPALDAVFDLSPHALTSGQSKPLDALLRARFEAALPEPVLSATATATGSLRWLGTIAV
jgi:hypothetical protein